MDMLEVFRDSRRVRRLPAGEILFKEGDPGDVMYVVTVGEVGITQGEKAVETLAPGGIFGEMALIDDRPRSGTATTLSDCELVPVDREWFSHLIRKNPQFAIHIMSIMTDRLRRLMEADD